jgi:hypothetical protein
MWEGRVVRRHELTDPAGAQLQPLLPQVAAPVASLPTPPGRSPKRSASGCFTFVDVQNEPLGVRVDLRVVSATW